MVETGIIGRMYQYATSIIYRCCVAQLCGINVAVIGVDW